MRLLTIVRRATSSEQHYVCLAVVLSAKDRSLTVSTKEELLQTYCEYSSKVEQPVSFIASDCVSFSLHQMMSNISNKSISLLILVGLGQSNRNRRVVKWEKSAYLKYLRKLSLVGFQSLTQS